MANPNPVDFNIKGKVVFNSLTDDDSCFCNQAQDIAYIELADGRMVDVGAYYENNEDLTDSIYCIRVWTDEDAWDTNNFLAEYECKTWQEVVKYVEAL